MLSLENSLRRVHWMCLVGVEENTLPITSIDVALPTPHDYSGAFQGGCSARFTASRRVLKGARRAQYPSETAQGEHCSQLSLNSYNKFTSAQMHTSSVDQLTWFPASVHLNQHFEGLPSVITQGPGGIQGLGSLLTIQCLSHPQIGYTYVYN